MSAASSAASSSLSRPKSAVLIVAALVCAYGSYYLWSTANEEALFESNATASNSLHRSNAVHRRRRRTNSHANTQQHDGEWVGTEGLPRDLVEGNARTLTDGETVVDDAAATEDWGWNQPLPYERNGQNIVQLLFRVSEDATRRNAYVHRGCECNSCGQIPIRGIRYHCSNCADYDLCEGCESQGLHIKTHIFYKIRVPAPSFGPILTMPVAYSGDPDTVELKVLSKELTTKLSRETGFERPELDAYWEQWTFMANTEWREDPDEIGLAMDRKTFEHCLIPSGGYRQPAPGLIFDRMFAFYDTNHDDLISFPEFLHGVAFRKKKDKWIKVFQGYDVDNDGYVDRKDFLRLWRSYYALFRRMHRDMLSGMQEQQMITSQAHQLVSGRQPLSSMFASSEMRPRGVEIRAGEGKAVQRNGELEIVDGRGNISASGNDTMSREEVYRSNNAPSSFYHRDPSTTAYWETMLNPPQNLLQLGETVRQLEGARNVVREVLHEDILRRRGADDETSVDEYDSDADSISDPDRDHSWMPTDVELLDEDAAAVDGPGTRLTDVQRTSRRAVIAQALARERTEKELHDRWKRRQFYTDEEEGGQPPRDWKDEEDILINGMNVGESSKSQSRPFYRSRSSSKVRFAEDMDDFDTRSNPSTSSRSVPERWGGFDIPEAERDAGKEILFQVTQQAFNELVDPLFKDLEDKAVQAAERKGDLEKYRSQFEESEFHKWATWESARLKAETEQQKTEALSTTPPTEDTRPFWNTLNVVDLPEVRERPLQELLEATGYEITPSQNGIPFTLEDESPAREAIDEIRVESTINLQIEDESLGPLSRSPVNRSQIDISALQNSYPELQDLASPPIESAILSSPITPEPEPEPTLESILDTYRDPTMPQFRPDTVPVPVPVITSPSVAWEETFSDSDQKENTSPEIQPSSSSSPKGKEKGLSRAALFQLWKLDQEVKEADRRGGWGRLDFEEFHAKVKKNVKEGRGNQMDYLGSWIDFCIP